MSNAHSNFESGLDALFADDDDLLTLDLTEDNAVAKPQGKKPWKILIVDDEPEVHSVTKLSLSYFEFDNRNLAFESAFSGGEARKMLALEPDYALVLLDVVMESDDAGLQVVDYIRNELQNKYVRIVLRTGQPGAAPEEEVVNRYDIDDYKAKTELTAKKLTTTVVSSLRAYRELQRVDQLVKERTAELERLNQEMTDSIVAAQRIQAAILPSSDIIATHIPKFIIFYRPKDIVSGDFYWFSENEGKKVIANIDCTGHGVPGAIMSVFSFNLMKHVVEHQGITEPDKILCELDNALKIYLNNSEKDGITHGMDMSVVVLDNENRTISFAGANQAVYLLRNGDLTEFSGDRMPIGQSHHVDKIFNVRKMPVESGDRFYLCTDGITDQFGGEFGRKFTPKRLKEMLQLIQPHSIEQQLNEISTVFEKWKNNYAQTDDVCLLGLEID